MKKSTEQAVEKFKRAIVWEERVKNSPGNRASDRHQAMQDVVHAGSDLREAILADDSIKVD